MKKSIVGKVIGMLTCAAAFASLTVNAADPGWFKEGAAWTFNNGYEFRNKQTGQTAKGAFALVKEDGKDGGKLDYDFSEAGAYVMGGSKVSGGDFNVLKITVKSEAAANLRARVEDVSGETHQFKFRYDTPGKPMVLTLDLTKLHENFGGDKNRVFDLPVTKLFLGVAKDPACLKGSVVFYDLDASKK